MGARWPPRCAWPTAAWWWLAANTSAATGQRPGRWTSTTPRPMPGPACRACPCRCVPTPTGPGAPPSSRPAMAAWCWAGSGTRTARPGARRPQRHGLCRQLAAGRRAALAAHRWRAAGTAGQARRGGRWPAQPRRLRQLLRAQARRGPGRARRPGPAFGPGGLAFNGPGVARRGQALRGRWPAFCHHRLRPDALWQPGRADRPQDRPGHPTRYRALVAGALDAAWVDDDRVLVKGRLAASIRGFEGDLASSMPEGSGALALYRVSSRSWTRFDVPGLGAAACWACVRAWPCS